MDKKDISLYVPTHEDYWFERKLLTDVETMYYNAGYECNVDGYDYNTGCIEFDSDTWEDRYKTRSESDFYTAYIKAKDKFVGFVSYKYDIKRNIYVCGMLIDANERDRGYAKAGLRLLLDVARNDGIEEMYSCFADGKTITDIFTSAGFKIVKEYEWTRFGEPTKGLLVKIDLKER